MALELAGTVFTILRKIYKVVTEAKKNLALINEAVADNREVIKRLRADTENPAMRHFLEQDPELKTKIDNALKKVCVHRLILLLFLFRPKSFL